MAENTAEAKTVRRPYLMASIQALGMLPILILLALTFQISSGYIETHNLSSALTGGRFMSWQILSIFAAPTSINPVLAAGMTLCHSYRWDRSFGGINPGSIGHV